MSRPDGGTPRILRGPLPGTRACDSSGGPRARPHGTPPGLVSALPRGFTGPGPRGRERPRCAHDAAGARLADDGRSPRPSVAVGTGLTAVIFECPSAT